ncbi:MAG: M20/M25/M40 family metallo-hydrolase [Bacteroidota bacterium]
MRAQTPAVSAADLRAHVKVLASDALEGRAAGSTGSRLAAEYIARRFRALGLGNYSEYREYIREFEFVSGLKLGDGNSLLLADRRTGASVGGTLHGDFRPLGFSARDSVAVPCVFAGYGIVAPEKEYDDYAGVDVAGKAVVVLRYSPEGSDPHSDFNRHSSLRNKVRIAREKGARAFILITGPCDEPEDELLKLSYDRAFAGSGIPAVSMKRSLLEMMLGEGFPTLAAIQDSINRTKRPLSFSLHPWSISLRCDVVAIPDTAANVVGYLEGADPALRDEAIVIGAHFDHLGFGGEGSGSLVPDTHAVHNGADDNASGVAGLLELAEYFAAGAARPARTLVFAAFDGEEAGTLGSARFVKDPPLPAERIVAMLNMDMVGRLRRNELTIHGTGTSPAWDSLVGEASAAVQGEGSLPFALTKVEDGFGPSDHSQFYARDIPVLFFFTGSHDDYHKPSDDWDRINYDGQERVVRFVADLAYRAASLSSRPGFARVASTRPPGMGDTRGFSVTLGIVPDPGQAAGGMRIGGIRPDGPAEKAGLRAGDLLVEMAGKQVLSIYDYMGILGELKAGQEVSVKVRRDGELVETRAVMKKR